MEDMTVIPIEALREARSLDVLKSQYHARRNRRPGSHEEQRRVEQEMNEIDGLYTELFKQAREARP